MTGWKSRFAEVLKTRAVIAAFILSLVGWFLLGILVFGFFCEEKLSDIEDFAQSAGFVWGLRIIVLGLLITLLRKNEWLAGVLHNRSIKKYLYVFFGIGIAGWLAGIIDLLVP